MCLNLSVLNLLILHSASNNHLDRAETGNPNSPSVTNFPCVVFASVGAMNIGLGIGTLLLVCISKKVRTQLLYSETMATEHMALRCGWLAISVTQYSSYSLRSDSGQHWELATSCNRSQFLRMISG